jgi:hypothetical protein
VGGYHLTDNNTVTQAGGITGNAAQFVRANREFLSVTDNPDLSMGDVDFTLAAWLYFDSFADSMHIVSKWTAGGNGEYVLALDVGQLRFYVSSNGASYKGVGSPTRLSTRTWYYVVCWHDSVEDKLYIQVNDGPVDSQSYSGGVHDGTSDFRIGARYYWDFFDGRVDAVGVWKRLLTSEERSALYNEGTGISYPFGGVSPDGSFSIAAGASSTVTVRFSPTAAQPYSETLSFVSNGGSASRTVTGIGDGAGAATSGLMAGRWQVFAALSGGPVEGWLKGDLSIDTEGAVTDGSVFDQTGFAYFFTDGSASTDENGNLTLTLTSPTETFNVTKAFTNPSRDLIVGVGSFNGSPMWLALIKEGGQFTKADMKGIWRLYTSESGGDQADDILEGHRFGWLRVGTSGEVLNGSATASGGLVSSQALGQLNLTDNGTFTGSYNYIEGAEDTIIAASLSPQKNFAAGVGYHEDLGLKQYFLFVGTREAGSFNTLDLTGAWQGSTITSNSAPLREGCDYRLLVIDSTGSVTGESITDCNGTTETITGNQLSLGADGEISGQIATTAELSKIQQASMTSTKNEVVLIVRSELDDSYSLILALRR